MKNIPIILLAVFVSPAFVHAVEDCACETAPSVAPASVHPVEAPVGHPLKGVVVDVLAEKSALLVKHEEIPGVMKAMTMLLKVDAATVKSVRKGDAVTGSLVRKSDGWWLEEVRRVSPAG